VFITTTPCHFRYKKIEKTATQNGFFLREAIRLCVPLPGGGKIKRHTDSMTSFEVKQLKAVIDPLLRERQILGPQNLNIKIPSNLMSTRASLLQVCLQPEATFDSVGWAPHYCDFPYGVFKVLQQSPSSVQIPQVHPEIPKIRYVEFMAKVFEQEPLQVLLGVYSAFGADLDLYPLRVLQILQNAKLLRTGLKLPCLLGKPGTFLQCPGADLRTPAKTKKQKPSPVIQNLTPNKKFVTSNSDSKRWEFTPSVPNPNVSFFFPPGPPQICLNEILP